MKPQCSNKRSNAFTLTEVLVILAVVGLFVVMLIPTSKSNGRSARKVACMSNLKQITLCFRLWEGKWGQDDLYTTQYSVVRGGSMESVVTGNVAAVFMTMSNQLTTPKILVCPSDTDRQPATNFTADFGNKNTSYFVGINATEANPYCILVGDDNFEISGTPVKSGVLEIQTNTPIAWTGQRHKFCGNIGFSDGSVQSVTSSGLTNVIIKQWDSGDTNRFPFAIP